MRQALVLTHAAQEQWAAAWIGVQLGHVARQQGRFEVARSYYAGSLSFYHCNDLRWGLPECLEGLVEVQVARAMPELERATWLLSAADRLRRSMSHVRPALERQAYEGMLAAVRERLDAARFAAAWEAGQAMPVDRGVAIALGGQT